MSQEAPQGLVRGIRRWDLVALVINGVIGAGIFGLPAKAFALTNTYSLFALLACAVFASLIILCFAEVSSRFTGTGGPYLYAREAFGERIGFVIGWLMWLTRVTAFASICNLLVSYLAYFWPAADSELFLKLGENPLGPIAHPRHVRAGAQAGDVRGVAPELPGDGHAAQRGPVTGRGRILRAGQAQAALRATAVACRAGGPSQSWATPQSGSCCRPTA